MSKHDSHRVDYINHHILQNNLMHSNVIGTTSWHISTIYNMQQVAQQSQRDSMMNNVGWNICWHMKTASDLQCHSRSLAFVPFFWPHIISYWSAIVTMSLSNTISEAVSLIYRKFERSCDPQHAYLGDRLSTPRDALTLWTSPQPMLLRRLLLTI